MCEGTVNVGETLPGFTGKPVPPKAVREKEFIRTVGREGGELLRCRARRELKGGRGI